MILALILPSGAFLLQASSAATTYTDTLYLHVNPSSSYEVGTINTGGVTFNSTQPASR
ncbi:MAG: hypothetical protein ACREBS_08925 [Nitrososphaerales archaeon]